MSDNAPLLMIPGPTEFHTDILNAMSHKGTSHVDPHFIECFSEAIKSTRDVFLASDGQPFILSGSGTLGWDLTAANFIQPGDEALIVNTGYFGDRFGECLQIYGVKVQHINANAPGDRPSVDSIVSAVKENSNAKLLTITHVDTSTGVRMNLKEVCEAVRSVSPDILIAVDGVCALAGEELRMKDWDIDIYLTGSQKAIGVPSGLSITVIRPRALKVFNDYQAKEILPRSYYANVARWLPVMNAYEEKKPSYFATPAVNLVYALRVAYRILLENGGMEERFKEHKNVATDFRNALRNIGYSFVPVKEEYAAYTMSAIRYPNLKDGITSDDFRGSCKKNGIITAGGLHSQIKAEYFRVGHMGLSTRESSHIKRAIDAITEATKECCTNQTKL